MAEDYTDHDDLPPDISRPFETIILLPLAKRMAMDIRCEIAYGGGDPFVEGAAEGQMASYIIGPISSLFFPEDWTGCPEVCARGQHRDRG